LPDAQNNIINSVSQVVPMDIDFYHLERWPMTELTWAAVSFTFSNAMTTCSHIVSSPSRGLLVREPLFTLSAGVARCHRFGGLLLSLVHSIPVHHKTLSLFFVAPAGSKRRHMAGKPLFYCAGWGASLVYSLSVECSEDPDITRRLPVHGFRKSLRRAYYRLKSGCG
jgi:hypothetical protein